MALVLVQLFAAVVCESPDAVEENVDEGVVTLEPVSTTLDKLVEDKDGRFKLKDVKDVAGFQVSTVAVVVGRSSLSIRPKKVPTIRDMRWLPFDWVRQREEG